MKKLAPLAYLLATSLNLFLACDDSDIAQEEIISQNDEEEQSSDESEEENSDNEEESENEDTEDDEESNSSAMEIYLEASPDVITNNGEGPQTWAEGITLEAFKIDGSPATLVYDTEFKDEGFGVAGARWNQIDYYVMYQGEEVNASEQIVISFENGVSEITLTVGMMGANEGHPDGETGKWTGYDQNGNQIAEGVLGANDSNLGEEVKLESDSYGIYGIDLDAGQRIFRLEIEATGFGYGQGEPENRNYDNESGNQENNSDFNIVGISFTRL